MPADGAPTLAQAEAVGPEVMFEVEVLLLVTGFEVVSLVTTPLVVTTIWVMVETLVVMASRQVVVHCSWVWVEFVDDVLVSTVVA